MNLWLIVPGKPLHLSKSRLAPLLPVEERAAVSRTMLTHVLATAQSADLFAGIMVVSRDSQLLALAQHCGATGLMEHTRGLNPALEQARRAAIGEGAEGILVLPGDLPLLTVQDVTNLTQHGQATAGMVIAPSHNCGTNALLLRPPMSIPFAFGRNSFTRHLHLARRAGLPVTVVESPTLAADVDSPEDWREWNRGRLRNDS